jgi:hypothetical protein
MKAVIALLLALSALCATQAFAQGMGSRCYTPVGACPVFGLPLGGRCFCGNVPGTVGL